MRSSWWWAMTWPISWPITAASWSWFLATLKIPVYTPTLPPGRAKALGSSLTNTAVSQAVPCPLSAGSSRTSAVTTQRTYASCLVSLVWGVPDFVSAKACAPIWSSCAWETAPTYWVRPVGEVVVAQPATAAAAMRPSRSFFMARISLGSRFRLYGSADQRPVNRSEEHTSELHSLMRISYAVFCLKKKKKITQLNINQDQRYTINERYRKIMRAQYSDPEQKDTVHKQYLFNTKHTQ